MKYNFHEFVTCLKTLLEFTIEWDNEQWNRSYIAFKRQLEITNPEWIEKRTEIELYTHFANEFYQDATHETHDYWLK